MADTILWLFSKIYKKTQESQRPITYEVSFTKTITCIT